MIMIWLDFNDYIGYMRYFMANEYYNGYSDAGHAFP